MDLAKSNPAMLQTMQALFIERNKTTFQAAKYGTNPQLCAAYIKSHRGFVGPYGQGV